ncbi:hypothetical protein CLE01_34510 [Cryobacterium levicorallinum]|nr:hypothetical protein CLE01_34510 [Cryobacterium levicorallinum]
MDEDNPAAAPSTPSQVPSTSVTTRAVTLNGASNVAAERRTPASRARRADRSAKVLSGKTASATIPTRIGNEIPPGNKESKRSTTSASADAVETSRP